MMPRPGLDSLDIGSLDRENSNYEFEQVMVESPYVPQKASG